MSTKKLSIIGGGQAWFVWFIANLIVVFGFNLQTGYAFVNGSMGAELHLSVAQIALAGSVYAWLFAISQFFSGSILDALGIRKVFPVSVSLILIGAYLFANATSLNSLIAAQAFLAIGASFGFVGAGFTGALWFGFSKFGIMFGLTQTFASLGSFFGAIIFSNLIGSGISWDKVLTYMVYFGIVVLILVVLFIRDPITKENIPHKKINFKFFVDIIKSMIEVIKQRSIVVSAISGGITFGAFLSVAVLWGYKLMLIHGFSEISAGTITSMLWIGLAAGCPVVNMMSNKLQSRRHVMMATGIVQALSLLAMMYIPSTSILFMSTLMFVFGACAAGHMLAFTVGGEVVKPMYIGTSAAIINGMMFICSGFIIGFPGRFVHGDSLANYQSALFSIPIVLLIASVIVYCMKESFPKTN